MVDNIESVANQDVPEESPVREEIGDMLEETQSPEKSEVRESPAPGLFASSTVINMPPVHYISSWATESPVEPDISNEEALEDAYNNDGSSTKDRSEIFDELKSNPFKLKDCIVPYDEDESTYYEVDTEARVAGKLGGIIRVTVKQNRDGDQYLVRKRICDCQTIIIGLYTSLDSEHHFVEVSFAMYGKKNSVEWQSVNVPIDAIRITDAFKRELVAKGLAVEEANIREMIHYYGMCLRCNDSDSLSKTKTKFKTGFISEVTGWKKSSELGSYDMFVIGKFVYRIVGNHIERGASMFSDQKNVKPDKMLEPRGSAEGWARAVMRDDVINEKIVRFMCYHAAASLLLAPTNEVGHTIGLVGESSKGKTFTNMIALSQFAYPGDKAGKGGLLLTGDASKSGLSALLTTYNDLPCAIDEIKLMKKDTREYILYVMANGQEPLRSEQSGKLRDRGTIRSNMIAAGETSLITRFADNGTHARATMIKTDLPMKKLNISVVNWIKEQVGYNCGNILPMFLQVYARHEHQLDDWKRKYSSDLQKTTTDTIIGRKSDAFALDIVAGILIEEVYKILGISPISPADVVTDIWNQYVIEEQETPKELAAMSDTYDYISSLYTNRMIIEYGMKPDITYKEIRGWYSNKYYDIMPIEYEKFMKIRGYDDEDLSGIYSKWRANGWIKTIGSKNFRYQLKNMKTDSKGTTSNQYVFRIVKAVVEQELVKFGLIANSQNNNDDDAIESKQPSEMEKIWAIAHKNTSQTNKDNNTIDEADFPENPYEDHELSW